ncbi:MAG TPA: ribonuclease H [Candidatus Acidoferrales bacterium]|nr:ribonuclease H [Candidatus Acidoferrales bacterium]
MPLSHRNYLVYADGSCLKNPDGPGGWGVVVCDPDDNERELNGHAASTTNNRMELTAAIEGLRATEPGCHAVLRSDSQYVVNTMNLNWKRRANLDLWKLLDAETDARTVRFEWVRGHFTDPLNHRADELAVMGAKRRLVADGARKEKARPRRTASADESRASEKLAPMLTRNESIRECAGCGEEFVSAGEGEEYCSHARCQLKARS